MFLCLVTFFQFLIIHLIWWRSPFRLLKGVKGLFLWGILSAFGSAIYSYFYLEANFWPIVPTIFLSQGFLVMIYAHWYVGIDRSISIRILNELYKLGGSATIIELNSIYSKREMFNRRIETLIEGQWIESQNNELFCLPKAKAMAQWVRILRKIYRIKLAG